MCFSGCEKCSNGTSCSVCPTGRYGRLCGFPCECDGRCDVLTGECLNETCPDTFASCGERDQCNKCTIGWYGARCNNTCSRKCNGDCKQYSGHCNACFTGYFGTRCDMLCTYCHNGICNQEGDCTSCYNGSYEQLCNKFCSEDCLGNTCNTIDGSCQLTAQCPENCVRCTDKDICTECDVNHYGDLCALLCNSSCKDGRCDLESGRCDDCSSSYYGVFCENHCSLTCASGGCERKNGVCFGCKELSVHGPFCNLTCSNNCTDLQCSQEEGYCSNGCIPNHYGSMCDRICSENCVNTTTGSKCDSTGKCFNGCFDGFIGDTCTKVDTTDNGSNDGQMSGTPATAIGGAVTGLVVLAVVFILVVVVVLKRRKGRKKTYEDMLPQRSSQDKPYSTLALENTTEYEIPDSEPRSGLSMESKDTGVYYNNENVYYKNVGGNVQKK